MKYLDKLKPVWASIKEAMKPVAIATAQIIVKAILDQANEAFLQWVLKDVTKRAVESTGNTIKQEVLDKINKELKV